MDNVIALETLDWFEIFIGVVAIVLALQFLYKTFVEGIVQKFGIETKGMRERREDKEQLKTVIELAKTTAENLSKLQERHTEDEEEFRNNLNNYMEESRADRKALHDEMTRFTYNRENDRQVSIDREKRLDNRITEGNQRRDEIIDNISTSLNKLTEMFVKKDIEDMRWEILNFCSALTSGRKYNKESFDHVIQIHEKYEKVLEENNMENGRVTASMEVIMDVYKEKLKNGF